MSSTDDEHSPEGRDTKPENGADEAGKPAKTDAADSDSRARVTDVVAERVKQIRELMVAGSYVTGKTPYELAELWGLSASRIFDLSAEASRQVRAGMGEPDEIRTRVLGWLERAAAMATAEGGAKGAQALTGAAKELAAIAGVAAPQQVTVTGLADLLALGFKQDAGKPDDGEDA